MDGLFTNHELRAVLEMRRIAAPPWLSEIPSAGYDLRLEHHETHDPRTAEEKLPGNIVPARLVAHSVLAGTALGILVGQPLYGSLAGTGLGTVALSGYVQRQRAARRIDATCSILYLPAWEGRARFGNEITLRDADHELAVSVRPRSVDDPSLEFRLDVNGNECVRLPSLAGVCSSIRDEVPHYLQGCVIAAAEEITGIQQGRHKSPFVKRGLGFR